MEQDPQAAFNAQIEAVVKAYMEQDPQAEFEAQAAADVKAYMEQDPQAEFDAQIEADVKAYMEQDPQAEFDAITTAKLKAHIEHLFGLKFESTNWYILGYNLGYTDGGTVSWADMHSSFDNNSTVHKAPVGNLVETFEGYLEGFKDGKLFIDKKF